jgi:predicted GH43/DUF377 family glycosyl hydrolase
MVFKRFVFVLFVILIMLLSASSAVTVRGSVQGQLLLAATDSWELGILWRPCVVNAGSRYMMWYSGETEDHLTDRIGLATLPDGSTWTKYPQNPIMSGTPGQWDGGSVNDEWVLYESGQYKMWYGGQTIVDGNVTAYQIGYATSPDGIHWTKYAGNPVLTQGPSGTWDDRYVHIPTVIRNGSSYVMYYSGTSTKTSVHEVSLGMATSPDGVHWTKSSPPLTLTKSGWDTYQRVSDVVRVSGGYLMAYGGAPTLFPGPSPKVKIGFARSSDGTNWTPYADNPVIIGGSGTWDSGGVNYPMVLPVGDKLYIYYAAYASGQYEKSIGLAVLPAAQLPVPEYGSPVLIVAAVMFLAVLLIRWKRTPGVGGSFAQLGLSFPQ